MNDYRFEVPVWDFIHYYSSYFSVPKKDQYNSTQACIWFYEEFLSLPNIERPLISILNHLNSIEDLREVGEDEDGYGDMEYEEQALEMITFYINEYRYENQSIILGNEEFMIEDEDLVFELFLLLIVWLELLGDLVDDCFREETITKIRRINVDAFVYTFDTL